MSLPPRKPTAGSRAAGQSGECAGRSGWRPVGIGCATTGQPAAAPSASAAPPQASQPPPRHDPAGTAGQDGPARLVAVSARELLRLLGATVLPQAHRDPTHLLSWSSYGCRHQHQAAEAHRRWNNVTAAATT